MSGPEGPRVLLVDDDPDVLEFLETLFTMEEIPCVCASGAEAALAELKRPGVALVLVDIAMPSIDGIELCRRIKAEPSTRAVPVVILSARPSLKAETESLAAGAELFLRKPFDNDELVRLVRLRLKPTQ